MSKAAARGGMRRFLRLGLALVAFAAAIGAAAAVWRLYALGEAGGLWIIVAAGGGCAAVAGAWILSGALQTVFDDIERLRAAIVVATASDDGRLAPCDDPQREDEVSRLRGAVEILIAKKPSPTPNERLAAVLATLDEGVVAFSESGTVSLLNAPAKDMLAAHQVGIGSSIFSALERDGLIAGMERAQRAGEAVDWTLRDVEGRVYAAKICELLGHAGFVTRIVVDDGHRRTERDGARLATIEHDFSHHDAPPEAAMTPATPLADLPVFVFDTETTGLAVSTARIVQVGGTRAHGARVFPAANIDRLVNPGAPIPPLSTAAHGLTDAMVATAADFAGVWPRLDALMRGAVIVGHNIGFDLAMVERECALAGIRWKRPPELCVFLLAGMVFPDMMALDLDRVAARLGVSVRGRHTALGDALMTAEVWVRMIPLLEEAGVATYAEALAFSRKARRLTSKQKAMGW